MPSSIKFHHDLGMSIRPSNGSHDLVVVDFNQLRLLLNPPSWESRETNDDSSHDRTTEYA